MTVICFFLRLTVALPTTCISWFTTLNRCCVTSAGKSFGKSYTRTSPSVRGRKFIAKSANGYVFDCFALAFGTAFFTTFGLLVVFASTFGAGLAVVFGFDFETAFDGAFCFGVAFTTGLVVFAFDDGFACVLAFVTGFAGAFAFVVGFGVVFAFAVGFGALFAGCLVFCFAVVVFAFTFVVVFAFVSVFFAGLVVFLTMSNDPPLVGVFLSLIIAHAW